MHITNSGIMFISVFAEDPDGGRKMVGSADDWAEGLARKIEEKNLETISREKSVALRREIIEEQMPLLWEEVMREFQSHCEAYNAKLKPERKLALFRERDGFVIKPDALADIIQVSFSSQAKRITVRALSKSTTYEPRVFMDESGKVGLFSMYGEPSTPAMIARSAIEAATK